MTSERKQELNEKGLEIEKLIARCTEELKDPEISMEKREVITSMKKDWEQDQREIINILAIENYLNPALA